MSSPRVRFTPPPHNGQPALEEAASVFDPLHLLAAAGGFSGAYAVACPLDCKVLVLNKLYVAVRVISARRAFSLLCRDIAEVIHVEDDKFLNYNFESWREISALRAALKGQHEDWIRGVNFELQVPRVIRLLSFDRVPALPNDVKVA